MDSAHLNDEGALRFWEFDQDVLLELPDWNPYIFSQVPAIQFFRSLLHALREAQEQGASTWEVFDIGDEFAIQSRGDNLIWTTHDRDVPSVTNRLAFIQMVTSLWTQTKTMLINSHPSLALSPALNFYDGWAD